MFDEASQLDLCKIWSRKWSKGTKRNPYYTTKASGRNFQKLQAEFSNIPHAYYKPPFINYLNTGLGDKSREDI